jgi:hypothetical protein
MKIPFTGGCLCGEVRYECSAAPMLAANCHCRDCQQASGGPYAPAVLVPFNAFKITEGELTRFASPSIGGGENVRGFCAKCGSRITGAERPDLGFIGVLASSLDDPAAFKPVMDIFMSEAQPWDATDPQLPKHPQYPLRQ